MEECALQDGEPWASGTEEEEYKQLSRQGMSMRSCEIDDGQLSRHWTNMKSLVFRERV
jgi:hypothetical protein